MVTEDPAQSNAATETTPAAISPLRFAARVDRLRETYRGHPLTIEKMVGNLGADAHLFLVILVALAVFIPFLPGASMLFGYIVAVIGYRLAVAKNATLPRKLRERVIPPKLAEGMLGATHKFFRTMERLLKPRLDLFVAGRMWPRFYGLLMCIDGWLLFLPLPIPFTNLLPAVAILCLAGALMENDGLAGLVGMLVSVVTIGYFAALLFGSIVAVDMVVDDAVEEPSTHTAVETSPAR